MRHLFAVLVGLSLGSLVFFSHPSAYGDVIPSKVGKKDVKQVEKVSLELVKKGVHPQDAVDQAMRLTDRNLEYLAAHPESIQNGAGLLLEEWILAGVFLVLLIIIAIARAKG